MKRSHSQFGRNAGPAERTQQAITNRVRSSISFSKPSSQPIFRGSRYPLLRKKLDINYRDTSLPRRHRLPQTHVDSLPQAKKIDHSAVVDRNKPISSGSGLFPCDRNYFPRLLRISRRLLLHGGGRHAWSGVP